jgi:hypothetical protein
MRCKGNPVPRGITGPPCSWGIQIREPRPPGRGSLKWDSKVWLRVLRDSDHWVITLQITDPSSHQRGRPTETRQQISDSNIVTGSNIWSQVPQGCSIQRHTDWLTVSHKVTSNFKHPIRLYSSCKSGFIPPTILPVFMYTPGEGAAVSIVEEGSMSTFCWKLKTDYLVMQCLAL